MTGVLVKRRNLDTETDTQREEDVKTQGVEGHRQVKETGLEQILPSQSSEEINLTDTLILDFQPPELCNNKILLFKPSCLWYFVTAALANKYSTFMNSPFINI